MLRFLLITTGGTIGALATPDPQRAPLFSSFPPTGTDLVQRALPRLGLRPQDYRYTALPPRDSKHIDAAYRARLIKAILRSGQHRVLITHGTDALLATAETLYRTPHLRRKIIMLTGAMLPLANGLASDGQQNLAYACVRLLARRGLPPGIYIVLSDYHGKAADWQPRLYRYRPGLLVKQYAERSDRSRLVLQRAASARVVLPD